MSRNVSLTYIKPVKLWVYIFFYPVYFFNEILWLAVFPGTVEWSEKRSLRPLSSESTPEPVGITDSQKTDLQAALNVVSPGTALAVLLRKAALLVRHQWQTFPKIFCATIPQEVINCKACWYLEQYVNCVRKCDWLPDLQVNPWKKIKTFFRTSWAFIIRQIYV